MKHLEAYARHLRRPSRSILWFWNDYVANLGRFWDDSEAILGRFCDSGARGAQEGKTMKINRNINRRIGRNAFSGKILKDVLDEMQSRRFFIDIYCSKFQKWPFRCRVAKAPCTISAYTQQKWVPRIGDKSRATIPVVILVPIFWPLVEPFSSESLSMRICASEWTTDWQGLHIPGRARPRWNLCVLCFWTGTPPSQRIS